MRQIHLRPITLLLLNSTVDEQGGNADSRMYGVSEDGNIILFSSQATNLAGSNCGGVCEKNMATGTITRVDVSTSGVTPNGYVRYSVMSQTVRYVAFISTATNLIDGTTEPTGQTYVRDMQTGTTSIVSVDSSGNAVGSTSLQSQSWDYLTGVSNDGRFVSIDSGTIGQHVIANYPDNFYDYYDVLVADRSTNTWMLLDTQSSSTHTTYDARRSQMSCDGSFVVFQSGSGVDIADLRNGLRVTQIGLGGVYPQISCNGNYIVYATQNRTQITPTPSGMDAYDHLVEYNRVTEARQYIDDTATGQYNGGQNLVNSSTSPDLFMVQVSNNGDAVFNWGGPIGWGPYHRYVYFKHVSDGSGTLEGVEKTPNGTYLNLEQPIPSVRWAYLSGNGKYVVYATKDTQSLGITTSSSGYYDIVRSNTGM